MRNASQAHAFVFGDSFFRRPSARLGLCALLTAMATVTASCQGGGLLGGSNGEGDGGVPGGAMDGSGGGAGTAPLPDNTATDDGVLQIDGTYSNAKLYVGGPPRAWPPAGVAAVPGLGQRCSAKLDAKGTIPTEVPRAYFEQCAGCHGPTGAGTASSGNANYPAILRRHTADNFENLVRNGYKGRLGLMPHFDEERLSDDDLARIYGYLNGQPVLEQGICAAEPTQNEASFAATYQNGLAAWRKQDPSHDNAGCFQCHGPDGLTFAYFGYADGDIMRRALTHLDETDAFAVVDMVRGLRAKYAIARRDPFAARPFQPGGKVLDGNDAAERDLNFGRQLRAMGLKVANGYINSNADATLAASQLGNVNMHALRLPIPFNHLTQDKIHTDSPTALDCNADIDGCRDFASMSDWMPIMPHVYSDPNVMFSRTDAYLRQPDIEGFYPVFGAVPGDDSMPGEYGGGQLSRRLDHNKYRSQFVLDYCIRRELLELPGCYAQKGLLFDPNKHVVSIWEVGSYTNLFGSGLSSQPECDHGRGTCDPPQAPHFWTKLADGGKLSDSFQRLRHSWFTMHWIHFDPTLLQTGDATAEQSEYFTRSLFFANNDLEGARATTDKPTNSIFAAWQVLMHNMAVVTMPQAADCKKIPYTHPDAGNDARACTAVDLRSGLYPQLCSFAEGKGWRFNDSTWSLDYAPKEPERLELYQTLTGNMYRMFLRGLIHQLQQDNWMCDVAAQQLRIKRIKKFLAQDAIVAANGSQDQEMFATLEALIKASADKCPPLEATKAAAF